LNRHFKFGDPARSYLKTTVMENEQKSKVDKATQRNNETITCEKYCNKGIAGPDKVGYGGANS